MIIGITGKIGTGKTTLLEMLKEKGYKIVSMDEIGHSVLREMENKIRKKFGIKENNLREKLRKEVFNNKEKLKQLNELLHPKMKKNLENILKKTDKEEIVFVEAAVLFEMKIDKFMDKIIYLDAREDVILSRVKKRSGLNKTEIMKIIKSQKKYSHIKEKIDVYIDTSNKTKEEIYKILFKKLKLEVEDAC